MSAIREKGAYPTVDTSLNAVSLELMQQRTMRHLVEGFREVKKHDVDWPLLTYVERCEVDCLEEVGGTRPSRDKAVLLLADQFVLNEILLFFNFNNLIEISN